jgi:hypothetical protein
MQKKPTNCLLVKGVVGKAKQSTYDLPPEEHIYGKLIYRNPLENTSIILHHCKAITAETKKAIDYDYLKMNIKAAKLGIVDNGQVRKYRTEHPIYQKEKIVTKAKPKLPSDSNPNYCYGKPTRYNHPKLARLPQFRC